MKLNRRLLHLAPTRVFLAVVALGLAGGGLAIAQAGVVSRVVQRVFLERQAPGDVQALLAGLLAIIVLRALLAWALEAGAFRLAAAVKRDLRARLFERVLAAGPGYAAGERSGELAGTLTAGVEALDAYFSQYLPQLAWAALVPLAVLACVFPVDWLSALVLLLTGPLVPVFMLLIGSAADALTRRQYRALSLMSAHFLDVLQGLTTLKMLGRSREQAARIKRVSERFRDATLRVLRVAFLSAFALEMIATVSTALVAVQVGLRLLYGGIGFEQALFVLILAPEFYLPLRLLGTRFHAGMAGTAAAQRIFEILDQPEPAALPERAAQPEGAAARGRLSLAFRDVGFAYAGGRAAALCGATFDVRAGEHLALVGPSGAGKSTLAYLLLRFGEPQAGAIEVDGQPLAGWPAAQWRAQIAWVPQAPHLFAESAADNILRGRPGATPADVRRAAEQAGAHEFIAALPQGYDTPLGEQGARLSGGQAQRIALARALLKDAPILILDEATSQLDAAGEARVYAALQQARAGRTTITIAHRLALAACADRIVVLDAGRVAEQGTHAQLIAQDGLYARMLGAAAGAGPSPAPRVFCAGWPRPAARRLLLPPSRPDAGAPPTARDASKTPAVQRPAAGPGPSWPRPAASQPAGLAASRPDAGGTPAVQRPAAGAGPSWPRPARWPLSRLLRLAAPFAGTMALAVLLGTLTVGSSIGLMATSAWIIATAALHPSVADLGVAVVAVRFFGIARGGLRYLERLASHHVTFGLLARLRVWFYEALEPLAPARLMQYHSGDLLQRIVGDVETLQNFFVRLLAPPCVALLVALGTGAWLYAYDARLAAAVLALMAMAGVVTPLLVQRAGRGPGRRLPAAQAALSSALIDGVQGLADLLAFGGGASQAARVRAACEEVIALQGRLAQITGAQAALGALWSNLALWAVLAIATPLVAGSRLDGVMLPALALGVLAAFEAVLALPPAFQYLEHNLDAARRLFEIVDARPAVAAPAVPAPAPADFTLAAGNLCARYAPGEELALSGVSFVLRPGRRLAVVGPSGAGKSTLVNVLLRFWDYEGGHVTLGGRELREYDPADVRRWIAVVTQRAHLFNASVRENLLLARPAATEDEMVAAARRAQIHDFILSLPQGYDTLLGEQGVRVSGGERRRLAIARAFLQDAPIVVLDEATADLDTLTERDVLRAVQALADERAVLVITHRPDALAGPGDVLVLGAAGGAPLDRSQARALE